MSPNDTSNATGEEPRGRGWMDQPVLWSPADPWLGPLLLPTHAGTPWLCLWRGPRASSRYHMRAFLFLFQPRLCTWMPGPPASLGRRGSLPGSNKAPLLVYPPHAGVMYCMWKPELIAHMQTPPQGGSWGGRQSPRASLFLSFPHCFQMSAVEVLLIQGWEEVPSLCVKNRWLLRGGG